MANTSVCDFAKGFCAVDNPGGTSGILGGDVLYSPEASLAAGRRFFDSRVMSPMGDLRLPMLRDKRLRIVCAELVGRLRSIP